MPMFPVAGHSIQRIWTGFGLLPPCNLGMVVRGLFLQRSRATPEHRGKFSNASPKCKGSSHATCSRPPLLWMGVRALWRLKRQGTSLRAVGCASYSRSGTVTGRLEAGLLCISTWCVCLLARRPNST